MKKWQSLFRQLLSEDFLRLDQYDGCHLNNFFLFRKPHWSLRLPHEVMIIGTFAVSHGTAFLYWDTVLASDYRTPQHSHSEMIVVLLLMIKFGVYHREVVVVTRKEESLQSIKDR